MKKKQENIAALIKLGQAVSGEGEVLTLSDWDLSLEDLVELRSELSSMRNAIDIVNKALAVYWNDTYKGQSLEDEHTKWSVKAAKGKRIIDESSFYAWLASKDADDLSKLVSASAIKVGGMSPVERETFIDEEPTNATLSIVNNRRY